MRASARNSLLAAFLLASSVTAFASPEGVYLPAPPSGPDGEDVIETSSGARCRQSMNSNGTYLDVGVTGNVSNNVNDISYGYPSPLDTRNRGSTQALGYARVTVPLGHRPARLDCSRLYELEIAKMQREIALLKLNAQ